MTAPKVETETSAPPAHDKGSSVAPHEIPSSASSNPVTTEVVPPAKPPVTSSAASAKDNIEETDLATTHLD